MTDGQRSGSHAQAPTVAGPGAGPRGNGSPGGAAGPTPPRPVIVGVFPPPEIRTGGHRRFLELMRGLEERRYPVLLLQDPDVRGAEGVLPGRAVPVFGPSAGGGRTNHGGRRGPGLPGRRPTLSSKGPAWWRYLHSVLRGRDAIHAAVAEHGPVPQPRPDGEERPAAPGAVVLAFSTTDYFAGKSVARFLDAPLIFALRSNIVTIHRRFGMLYKESKRFKRLQRFVQGFWKRFLESRIARGADTLVFQSDFDRDEVVGRNPSAAGKSVIVPNSMRASWFPPELSQTNRSERLERLLFLGSIGERKGIQFLLPAMRLLIKERGVDISLDLIGFGGLEEWCRNYIAEHDLGDRIRLLGRDPRPLGKLATADLLIVPSLYDSFPNTVLEALFVGTPVIGSDTSGIAAILGESALLFEPESVEAIADALEPLARDPLRYRRVRELCAGRREEFDFDWVAAFEAIIRGAR